MVQSSLPPQVKLLAAQFEDNMSQWVNRDLGNPRWDVLKVGGRARRLLRDLIDALVALDGELGGEVEVYGEAVRRVGT